MAHPIHKHMHTHITKRNVGAAERDDKAHIDYLKRDVLWDNKHGHSDIDMTADEKHISKLAGDIKYDKRKEHVSRRSSSPLHAHDESKVTELTRKIEARAKELTGDDPQSRVDPYEDDKIKTWIAERTAEKAKHKE